MRLLLLPLALVLSSEKAIESITSGLEVRSSRLHTQSANECGDFLRRGESARNGPVVRAAARSLKWAMGFRCASVVWSLASKFGFPEETESAHFGDAVSISSKWLVGRKYRASGACRSHMRPRVTSHKSAFDFSRFACCAAARPAITRSRRRT